MADYVERRWVSRYSQPGFGLKVHVAGALADADANPTVTLLDAAGDPLWTHPTTRDSLGAYVASLSSVDTSDPGFRALRWNYATASTPQVYVQDIEVGQSSPAYDALPPAWQDIVERVWLKFADLFDSPYGGPNLQTYVQTHFGRNRLAQLLPDVLQVLNSASSPWASYLVGGQDFPIDEWGGLLANALYIEVLKHLIRSYTEQPEAVLGTAISRLDRRDYFDRWQTVLGLETDAFNRDLSRYRQSHMNLGHVSVLVAGGAYGNWGPQLNPGGVGAAAARGYYWVTRWH